MSISQTSHVIAQLRRVVLLQDHAGLTDGQLLGYFLEQGDENAFASLVRRHGPMVWGVCCRVLGNDEDAEDAFQATFLVLVRKAASVVPRELVGNWLYGVARQTALQARRAVFRRRAREKQVAVLPERVIADHDAGHDLRPLLDQELSRLSDEYRAAIVLCDLEGKTRKEAARQLGWPEGTVAGRLARARELLAKRLARRGVTPSADALAGFASACVPGSVVSATIQAATVRAAGAISAQAAILTQGVLEAMFLTKLKTVAVVLAILGIVTLTGGMFADKGDGREKPVAGSGKGAPEKPEKIARVTLDQKHEKVQEDVKLLQGTWRCVGIELGGERIEGKRYSDRYGPNPLIISGNKLSLVLAKTKIDCTFVIDPTKSPRWIDSKREPDGLALSGIYELKDGRLKLYDSGGKRPTEFRTKKGTTDVFHIYEKDPKADAVNRERKNLAGTWRVVSSEVNGTKLADGTFEGIVVFDAEGRWKQRTSDGTTLTAGTSEIDLTSKPGAIRFTVTSKGNDKGKIVRKIYEFTGEDSLRWCPYASAKGRPAEFPRAGSGRTLDLLQRMKKPDLIEGTVKGVDGGSIHLKSDDRVLFDSKTRYFHESLHESTPAKLADVTEGKRVELWTKRQGEKRFAVAVMIRPMESDAANEITFVRRIYLDVLGIPPSPAAIDDFVKDQDKDKRKKLELRLTARLAPGHYTGACQTMVIDANGVVTYPDTPPSICHIELTADGHLKADFPDKKLGRGKWDTVPLKLSGREPRTVWTAVVAGDTYKATAIPYSPEAYLFRLEILTGGKLVAGAQQFYAIREAARPKAK